MDLVVSLEGNYIQLYDVPKQKKLRFLGAFCGLDGMLPLIFNISLTYIILLIIK
jgi:hypothetical protein